MEYNCHVLYNRVARSAMSPKARERLQVREKQSHNIKLKNTFNLVVVHRKLEVVLWQKMHKYIYIDM